MISNAQVIVNRCGRPGCGKVTAFVSRRQLPMWISEFAGNTPCERIEDHDMSEWTRVTILQDVLILQALWTVGRAIHPSLPSDPTAHILADSLGYELGDAAELRSLPEWMRDGHGLAWSAVILAARVAMARRDEWSTDQRPFRKWAKIMMYLRLWSDRVH